MNGNCHLINGLAISTMVSLNLNLITEITPIAIDNKTCAIALIVMGGLIGSVFPDIDNIDSHVGQLCKPFSSILDVLQTFFGKTGSNHRGILHDISLYLVGFFISLFIAPYLTGFFLGGLSHIFLDSFNPSGIPFIFGMGKFRLAKISSGSQRAITVSYLFTILIFEMGIALNLYALNNIF